MDSKMTSISLSAVALAGALLSAPVSSSAALTAPATATFRGGQAPSAPAGGTGSFAVIVAKGIPAAAASKLKEDLLAEGYTTADTRAAANGASDVVLAGLPSREQAEGIMGELRKSGFTPDSIAEGDSPSAPPPATAAAAPAGEPVFRVKVAEFDSQAEADEAKKVLADEGFVNVDTLEENNKFLLMLGTFNQKPDAEALLSDVSNAGFALAQVVERERLVPTEATAAREADDLSKLSASQLAATRDVLNMAQKVASGEASAAEAKALREQIQQLPDEQKAIVSEIESARATEREKLARIFPLYRKFDRAILTHDYDAAEAALSEVRSVDSTDIFLSGRQQQLDQARNKGTKVATGGKADPAELQRLLNEGRRLEREQKPGEAADQYRAALELDPTNVEARSKLADLRSNVTVPEGLKVEDPGVAGLLKNRNVWSAAAGILALIIIAMVLKARKRSAGPASSAPARPSGLGLGTGPDVVDPLDYSGGFNSTGSEALSPLSPTADSSAMSETMAASATDAPAFAAFDTGDEEEETMIAPAPVAPAAPAEPESDTVSLEGFDTTTAAGPAPAAEPLAPAEEETISLNFADEPTVMEPAVPATPPTPSPAPAASAMDADLEALLKGTFGGDPEETQLQSATPGRGVEDLMPAGVSPETPQPRLVFEQSFDQEPDGVSPQGWTGEYDYASLVVTRLDEAGHSQCLRYDKPDGTGSAAYHLSFPEARGLVTAEFDIRCDQKNKFLLGVYLEKDEDFKQSIHTIVHQLDANGPAALRIQGSATAYDMATWRHVRYEIDLNNGTLTGYVDTEEIVKDAPLSTIPEYINTLSIRDNLATTGTLYLDNIRISEG